MGKSRSEEDEGIIGDKRFRIESGDAAEEEAQRVKGRPAGEKATTRRSLPERVDHFRHFLNNPFRLFAKQT
ncbi:hypothetical protein Syun_004444 [Stephania yunnanensis]|uniref:Uncharacterized protein n=1 Tax=Stephania yunnanensis TaxID=152371 RepID=A0AAP0L319_9MAGN